MKRVHLLVAVTAFLASGGSVAQTGIATPARDSHAAHHVSDAKAGEGAYVEGEVRKVDKEAGKITLKHGPIANLEMPAMSMVFRTKDPAMLDQVRPGDKVRFKAEKIQGALTITELKPAK